MLATTGDQSPVCVLFDGLGAKHDSVLFVAIAEAKAPEERSWRMCKPGPEPMKDDILIWTPVIASGPSNKKS